MAATVLSTALLIVGLMFSLDGLRMGYGTAAQPEAGFIPSVIGMVVVLLAGADLAARLLGREAAPRADTDNRMRWRVLGGMARDRRVHFVAVIVLTLVLVDLIGAVVSFALFAACSSRLLGLRRWWMNVLFGLAVGAFIHYVLVAAFEIALPTGRFWDLLGR
jgi:hypothetical protein